MERPLQQGLRKGTNERDFQSAHFIWGRIPFLLKKRHGEKSCRNIDNKTLTCYNILIGAFGSPKITINAYGFYIGFFGATGLSASPERGGRTTMSAG